MNFTIAIYGCQKKGLTIRTVLETRMLYVVQFQKQETGTSQLGLFRESSRSIQVKGMQNVIFLACSNVKANSLKCSFCFTNFLEQGIDAVESGLSCKI